MATKSPSALDRSVKILGPDGSLRKWRCGQADALAFYRLGLCLACWNHAHTRISCIQWLGSSGRPEKPQRWLRTGTRFSYKERHAEQSVWAHKALPYAAADQQLHRLGTPEEITAEVRAMFLTVLSSILTDSTVQPTKKAAVISIEAFRQKRSLPPAPVEEMPQAA